jgi:transcription initiation factor TFIID subunit 7
MTSHSIATRSAGLQVFATWLLNSKPYHHTNCLSSQFRFFTPLVSAPIMDDLIVVDDYENEAGPSTSNRNGSIDSQAFYGSRPKNVAERNIGTSRLRSSSNALPADNVERATRSSTRPKLQPKLKLKLSDKAASQAPGMSFLGQYDRELDSDDEDLAFEEQFILRMPPGEDCEKLRKAVASREVGNDVWFKFKGTFPTGPHVPY